MTIAVRAGSNLLGEQFRELPKRYQACVWIVLKETLSKRDQPDELRVMLFQVPEFC